MSLSLTGQWAESGPVTAFRDAIARVLEAANRNVRLTAIVTVGIIFACFAAATVLQMRRDYAHALNMAERYTAAESRVMATQTARALDRLAALGSAYVNAADPGSAAEIVESAESDRVLNIAFADAAGHILGAMKGQPTAARPLTAPTLTRAAAGPDIEPYADPAVGSSPLTLIARAAPGSPAQFVVMPLDPMGLLPRHTLGETALFATDGRALALGAGWDQPPPASALRDEPGSSSLRYVAYNDERRIVALSAVPGWPLSIAASVQVNDALSTWYGSVPLYLFVILGPAVVGALLAFLVVREFERADRARSALVAVKAIGDARAGTNRKNGDPERLLARLADSERRAAEAERAKSEFVAHMSHELRTPLNAIIGFAEIIHSGLYGPPGHQKYAEYARDIALAGRDLHARIGDILDFANIEAERYPLCLASIDAARVAAAILDQFRGQALNRRIALGSDLPALPQVKADEAALKRILTIILSNALRYTPDGGAIRVAARKDENTFVLLIRDSGQGFSGEEAAQIGKSFIRFARPGNNGGTGLGLGLAMAMALARRMGGALRLAGAAGEGTWAELRLPLP